MIYTENNIYIDEAVDQLVEVLKDHPVFQEYQDSKQRMLTDVGTEKKRNYFYQCKNDYERISDYGKYAPGWKEKRQAVQKAKRQLDMDENMALFRQKETQVQMILDKICQEVSGQISSTIKVDAGNPFFTTKSSHCGGGCHVG